jgi:hypothetical protein
MRLGSVSELARAIGFEDGVQADVIESAMEAATQTLIGMLQTELDRAAVVDVFHILPSGSLPIGDQYRTRLALSRGFVEGELTLLYGSLASEITAEVDMDTVVTNLEKGSVVITGANLSGQYISVAYTAGFEPDETDADKYGGVPVWLDEVAVLAGMAALDQNSPATRHEKSSEAMASAKALNAQVSARVASKMRYFPSASRPLE